MRKRVLSMCMVVIMLVTYLSLDSFVGSAATIDYGDVNADGAINLQDLLLLERFVDDENSVSIDIDKADVLHDGVVDEKDVQLLKRYLAGWDVVLGTVDGGSSGTCTLTFDTLGGGEIAPMEVSCGAAVTEEIEAPAKAGYLFTGWQDEAGEVFYANEPVVADMALTATYEAMDDNQELSLNSFALLEQEPSLSFLVKSATSLDEVKAGVSLQSMNGSDEIALRIVDTADGTFSISAENGFSEGSSYQLTLAEGIDFDGKASSIRVCCFSIDKEENDNILYNNDLIFIQDTDEMSYRLEGEAEELDVLQAALLSNDESDSDIKGTFQMEDTFLKAGDYVCIYQTVHPKSRDYTNHNYEDDAEAYLKITAVSGDVVSFAGLDEEDFEHVLMVPDCIPVKVSALPTGTTGEHEKGNYDVGAWATLGHDKLPEFRVGDYLTFYVGNFEDATASTPVYYGKITSVDDTQLSYVKVTKQDIQDGMNFFVQNGLPFDSLVEDFDEVALLEDVRRQVVSSGFDNEVYQYLYEQVAATDEYQSKYEELFTEALPDKEGLFVATSSAAKKRAEYTVEDPSIDVEIIHGKHFEGGVGVRISLSATLSVEKQLTTGKTASLKVMVYISFEQELGFDMTLQIEDDWDVYVIIPVLNEMAINASIDIKSFSGVSVGAKIFTVSEAVVKKWNKLEGTLQEQKITQQRLAQIDRLSTKLRKMKKKAEPIEDVMNEIASIKTMLPSVEVDGKQYSIEELEEACGVTSVSETLGSMLDCESPDQIDAGLQNLMDQYSAMLENESDWVELVNIPMFEQEIHVSVFAIGIKANFVIRANVNIAVGASLEYQYGKRFSFWCKLVEGTKGSSEMDLLDERFAFQFYVMGTIGLKAGVVLDLSVGLFSTKIGSIGIVAEVGLYVKLWGYFIYEYSKLRPIGATNFQYDESMLGAIYLEFGVYLTLSLKAQLLDDLLRYDYKICSYELPLLTAGTKYHIYGFDVDESELEALSIEDEDKNSANGYSMELPDVYYTMNQMQLNTGAQTKVIQKPTDFLYQSNDKRITVSDSGVITVNPDANDRYISAEVTITWKNKVDFSDYDMSITIPVVWTNYSEAEQNTKHTATLLAGNDTDGYVVLWTGQFTRMETFSLPSQTEVLSLLDYELYNDGDTNLCYEGVGSYSGASTDLSITNDTTYYYNIDWKHYPVQVNEVQLEDGSVVTRDYSFTYKGEYSYTDLQETGTRDEENKNFTMFYDLLDSEGNPVDLTGDINLAWVKNTANKTLTARYTTNTSKATYHFIGVPAEDVVFSFERGTIPRYDGLNAYLETFGAVVKEISPAIVKSSQSVTYNVLCEYAEAGTSWYTLHYNTGCEIVIPEDRYASGTKLYLPEDVSRKGYTFIGWYQDAACSVPFMSTVMPGSDTTVYAKFTANTYQVSFEAIPYELSNEVNLRKIDVTYDGNFPTLPEPRCATQKFLGWYMKVAGEDVLVESGDLYQFAENVKLVSKWGALPVLPEAEILFKNYKEDGAPNVTYNTSPWPWSFGSEGLSSQQIQLAEDYSSLDGLVIKYKNDSGTDFVDYQNWNVTAPENAGSYLVAVFREADNEYQAYETADSPIKFVIEKADLSLGAPKTYTNGRNLYIQAPMNIPGDGKIEYSYDLMSSFSTLLLPTKTSEWNESQYYGDWLTGILAYDKYKAKYRYINATNYNDVIVSTDKRDLPSALSEGTTYHIYAKFVTGEADAGESNPGTVATPKAYLSLLDGTKTTAIEMNGSGGDFTRGGFVDICKVADVTVPWELERLTFSLDSIDHWKCESVQIGYVLNEKDADNTFIPITEVITVDCWLGEDTTELTVDISSKREVKSLPNFDLSAYNETLTDTTTGVYSFAWDGIITDQFISQYNAYSNFDPPALCATANDPYFNRFAGYSDYNELSVDKAALYQAMVEKKVNAVTYTVKVKFPERSTEPVECSKKITFTVPGIGGSSQSVNTDMDNTKMKLMAESVECKYGDTVEMKVNLSENAGLWGVLSKISYDREVLELVDVTGGEVFTDTEVFGAENYDKPFYTLLASRDSFTDTDKNGTVVALHFRVKQSTSSGSYAVAVENLQTIDSAGRVLDVASENGSILILENNPKTGDYRTVWYVFCFVCAAFGMSYVAYKKRRNRQIAR